MSLRGVFLELAQMYGLGQEVASLLEDRPDPPAVGLGPLLQDHRARQFGTIKSVHHRAGVSRSQLSFYENGQQKNPGIRTMQALSYGYRIPFPMVLAACVLDAGTFTAPGAAVIPEVRERKRTRVR